MATSPAWDRFVASLDIQSLDSFRSVDLAAIRELSDVEKEHARRLIVPMLEQGDPRMVDALVEIDTPAALADVERAFVSGFGEAQVRAAEYLWRARKDLRVVPVLRGVALQNPAATTVGTQIVGVLKQVGGDEADRALVDILAAAPGVVASATVDALFGRLRFDDWEGVVGGKVQTLRWGLISLFPSVRNQAIDELRDLIARRRGGANDRQLGVDGAGGDRSASLERVVVAANDASQSVPHDALDAVTGGERDYATDVWIGRLEDGDSRAVAALKRLDTPRARLALADFQAGRKLS